MITFSTNQRRSVRWDGSSWREEVLAASGVEVSTDGFLTISGAEVQAVLQAIDNELTGIDYSTSSGTIHIEDVSNVSGTVGGTMGNLDTVDLEDAADSSFRFSFTVPAQPAGAAPVKVRVLLAARGETGNVKLDLDYDIFDPSDDPTAGAFALSKTVTEVVGVGDTDIIKLITFDLPASEFSTAGSAPYVVSCRLKRDTAVGGNVAADVSVIKLYADNVPGAHTGNTAGYIGGNLTVDGSLTVEGLAVLEGGLVPASATDVGISGSLVLDDDFIYIAVGTNQWKRVAISQF